MSLRDDLLPALRSLGTRPGVLLLALAIATALTLAPTAAGAGIAMFAPELIGLLAPIATVTVVIVLLPALAGLYAPMAAPPDGVGATLRRAGAAIGAHYGRLLVVAALTVAAAVGAALLAVLLWLPLDTLVRYARYAVADPGAPSASEHVLWLAHVVVVGAAVGSGVLRVADTAVVHDGRGPRAALWTSLRFARHHALSLAGLYLLIGAIGTLGAVLATAVLGVLGSGGDVAASGLAGIPILGLTIALVAAVQSAYYRRTVAPAVDALGASDPLPWRRIAAASVVLLAAVGGAAYVRSHEIRPLPEGDATLPEEPSAAYATALSNTLAHSHRVETTAWNLTAGGESTRQRVRTLDVPDRRLTVFVQGRTHTLGAYADPGVHGVYPGGRTSIAAARWDRANWSRIPTAGYGLSSIPGEPELRGLPAAAADWTVANRTDRQLRLRVEDPDAVATAVEGLILLGPYSMAAGSHGEVVIDRRTGTVLRSEFVVVTNERGRLRHVTTVEAGDRVDVTRPPALGDRRPAEWLFATLYY